MPTDENGDKWACEPCIRGHRSTKCEHFDRFMLRVKKPGRPLSSCPHPRNSCSCGRERVMMARIFKASTCLCAPKYVLTPDGHPLPASGPPAARQPQPLPTPLPPLEGPPSPRLKRPPDANGAAYRIKKHHSRSGSTIDTQRISRAFDSGKILEQFAQPSPASDNRPRSSSLATFYNQSSLKHYDDEIHQAPVGALPLQTPNQTMPGLPSTFVKQETVEPSYSNGWPSEESSSRASSCSTLITDHPDAPRDWAFQMNNGNTWNDQIPMAMENAPSATNVSWAPSMPSYFVPLPDASVASQRSYMSGPGHRLSTTNGASEPVLRNSVIGQVGPLPETSHRLLNHSYANGALPNDALPDADALCSCGPDCSCLMCPVHPDNETTRARVNTLRNILEEDSLENMNSRFSSFSYIGAADVNGVSQNLSNAFPNGLQSPTLPQNNMQMPYTNGSEPESPNGTASAPPWDSSNYFTVEYPSYSCSDPSGECMCDDNCSCVGCLTHRTRDEAPTEPSSNGHGEKSGSTTRQNSEEPVKRSCCS